MSRRGGNRLFLLLGPLTPPRPLRPVPANEAVLESGRLAGEALSATIGVTQHGGWDPRVLDDNAQIMLRYANGARGAIWLSQVVPGHENGLRLGVYGTTGSLRWTQENLNEMLHSPFGEPTHILTRAGPRSGEAAARVTRVPSGHPEGYLKGFANIYCDVALAIKAARTGGKPPDGAYFPGVEDGVKGMAFIEAAVESSKADGRWVKPAAP